MSFTLNAEQKMVSLMARDFARKELEPFASEWEKNGIFPVEAVRKMGGLGLLGMMVPTEYGGSAAGAVSYCLALQEIAYACASTAVTMSVANLSTEPLLKFGNPAQKEKYLTRLASGEWLGCFALTEPSAGSDPGGLQIRAIDRGDHFLVNGTKIFITHGGYADLVNLIVRTGQDKGNKDLSAIIVEKGTPGFSVGSKEDKMGLRASNTVELIFEDCRVPKENLLGKLGQGFKIAMTALDSGRIGIASQALGIARACLDEAVRYAKERRQFGRAISSFQAIQWMIADMATGIEAAHLLTLSAAHRKDQGVAFTREASMAKLFSSEIANKVAYHALQIHGGYGYTKEFKIERLARDARATTIYEGTSEVQRIVIAREVLKV
ncbi:MAG TPA: acyl-CoA dehydrogenase family protein [Deltaproteobacteria bacterium]|nr:acyl-CoA dehydrogenase family protein [Deltaproteobacteria bacterium]HOI06980.1 acyl-CoA dehydrogenase family protein [Deltaproteobacteria bacterium]